MGRAIELSEDADINLVKEGLVNWEWGDVANIIDAKHVKMNISDAISVNAAKVVIDEIVKTVENDRGIWCYLTENLPITFFPLGDDDDHLILKINVSELIERALQDAFRGDCTYETETIDACAAKLRMFADRCDALSKQLSANETSAR